MSALGDIVAFAGFEGRNLDMYTTAAFSSGSLSTAWAATGSKSLLCPGQQYVMIPLGYNSSKACDAIGISGAFYISASDDISTGETPSLIVPNFGVLPWYRITVVGGVRKLSLCNGTNYGTCTEVWQGSYTIATATEYRFSMYMVKEGTNYWPSRFKLFSSDLSTLHEDSGWRGLIGTGAANNGVNAASTNSVYIGHAQDGGATAKNHDYHFDDIVITRGCPAPMARITGAAPSADGTDDDFIEDPTTGGGAQTYQEVSDGSDSTWATSKGGSGSKNVQTYDHAGMSDPGTTGNILAVCGHARAARDDTTSSAFGQGRLRTSGGAFHPGNAVTLSALSSYPVRALSRVSQAGNGWTSGTGSETSLNDLEFGIFRTSTLFKDVKVMDAFLEAAWGTDWTNTGNYEFMKTKKTYVTGGVA